MTKSYTLNNWDGRGSTSEQHTETENRTNTNWDNRSNANLGSRGQTMEGETTGERRNELADKPLEDVLPHLSVKSEEQVLAFGDLPFSTTATRPNSVQHASNEVQPVILTFLPNLDSPLHSPLARNASRRGQSPIITQLVQAAMCRPQLQLQPPAHSENTHDAVDAISLYTTDAEGEEEDDEGIVVQSLLSFSSPTKTERSSDVRDASGSSHSNSESQSGHNSLFTPPLSDEYPYPSGDGVDCPSADRLFTPPPETEPSPLRCGSAPISVPPTPTPATLRLTTTATPRFIMSHVQVPPLRRPKSDYSLKAKKPRPTSPLQPQHRLIQSKEKHNPHPQPKHSAVQVHGSLGDALQASLNHNEKLGTLHYNSQNQKIILKKDHRNAIAGPSTSRLSSVSDPVVSGSRSTSVSATNSTINEKKRRRKYEDDGDWSEIGKKRKRVDIDLTLSDSNDDEVEVEFAKLKAKGRLNPSIIHPKPKAVDARPQFKPNLSKPQPHPKSTQPPTKQVIEARAVYNQYSGNVRLYLGVVRPVRREVLAFNTRFMRSFVEKEGMTQGEGKRDVATGGRLTEEAEHTKAWTRGTVPWFCRLPPSQASSQSSESSDRDSEKEDEISLGCPVLTSTSISPSTTLSPMAESMSVSTRTSWGPNSDVEAHDDLFSADDAWDGSSRGDGAAGLESSDDDRPLMESKLIRQKGKGKEKVVSSMKHPMTPARVTGQASTSSNPPATGASISTPFPSKPTPGRPAKPPPKIDLAERFRKKDKKKERAGVASASTNGHSIVHSTSTASSDVGVSATSAHPTPGTFSQHQSQTEDLTAQQAKDFGRIMPSAKALGKRRAVSPSSVIVSGSAPIPVSGHVRGVEADSFTAINDNLNANPNAHPHTLDIFIHNYMPDPEISSGPSSSSNSIFAIRQSSTGFYSNMETLSSLNSPTHPQSQPQFRQEGEAALSSRGGGSRSHHPDSSRASQDSEKLFSELDNLGTRDQSEATDPWAESFAGGGAMPMDAQYTLSTINPTLLGGQTLDDQFSEPDLDIRADVVEDGEDENDPVVRRSQPPLGTWAGITALVNYSSSSGSSSASNPSEYEPSVATDPAVERTTTKRKKKQPSPETTAVPARTLPRRHAQRQMTDMVPTDQLDAFLSGKQSEDSLYSTPSDEDSGSDASSAVVVVRKSVSVSGQRAGASKIRRRGSKKVDKVPAINWPKTNFPSYCHQCRRKTDLLKMPCSCGKQFCVRCFAVRYPDEEFDVTPRDFTCPACQGYCNCTMCCSKRGETYVSSSRPDGHRGPPPGKRVTLGGKTNLPPLTLAGPIPESGKYWSTIYSLTGERIGTTYIPSHVDGDPSVVFAPTAPAQVLDQPKSNPKKATKKKKIFVGQIQPSWNLELHPKIKYVDSSSRSKKAANDNTRWYVGNRSFLNYIVEPVDKTGLLDDLSSLSSLEDDSMDESESLEPKALPPEVSMTAKCPG